MKNFLIGVWGVVAAALLLAAMILPASAAVQTFHAKGEYTMSDYETPAVAEERAFAYAKQRAAEQAGVYVASYTKSVNAQISEDRVNLLVGTLLQIKNKSTHKEAMVNGDVHIIVELDADMDTSAIDESLRETKEQRMGTAAMYANLQKDIAKQQKENEELKQKIAALRAKGESTETLVRESKAKERAFQSNQKVEEAWGLYESKQYDAAIALCDEAIRLNPKNEVAYLTRGIVYESIYNFNYGIHLISRIPFDSITPDNMLYYWEYGLVYAQKALHTDGFAQSIEDYSRAIAINPDEAIYYVERGNAYNFNGEQDCAIEDYSRAIAVNPNEAKYFIRRGNFYYDKGDYDSAIADYTHALELNPKDAGAYFLRGAAYGGKGDYDQAIANYTRALELNPKCKEVYINRGVAYGKKGEYDRAIADYTRVLELTPKDADAYNNRGLAYMRKGDYDKAIEDFNRTLELAPNHEKARENLQQAREAKAGR